MPVCSYLVIPRTGVADAAAARLAALPGCEVARAAHGDLLILVTDTDGRDADEALRGRIQEVDEIQALLLTFGEIDPAAEAAGPRAAGLAPLPSLP